LRAQARNRGRKSAEDTHDIFSKFDPGGSPVQAASGEDVASVVPNSKINKNQ
jgi:hypothetical protein